MTSLVAVAAQATHADAAFSRAMAVPEALLALRDEMPAKQWVHRDVAINRSVVVLTVAAWQAWVETFVGDALTDSIEDLERRSIDDDYLRLLRASRPLVELARHEVTRFSTPNASEVCRLLSLIGHDPSRSWASLEGPEVGSRGVADRLNGWVKVRHAIAHGHAHLPLVAVIGRTKAGHGSLTHRHAAQCVAFFRLLAATTGLRSA